MKVGVLFSGGKDSTYSAFLAKAKDQVVCLITVQPSRDDSYMFHFPNLPWTALQAEAMGIPQVLVQTQGIKELELKDLTRALQIAKTEYGIEGVYTGALASSYQKSRVDRISQEQGLKAFSPLWGIDSRTHLNNIVSNQFDVIITGVAALGLDQTWLGRHLDEKMIDDLMELEKKHGMHAALEGGEGETFVLDCPIFASRIDVISSKIHWNGSYGFLEILEARLANKL